MAASFWRLGEAGDASSALVEPVLEVADAIRALDREAALARLDRERCARDGDARERSLEITRAIASSAAGAAGSSASAARSACPPQGRTRFATTPAPASSLVHVAEAAVLAPLLALAGALGAWVVRRAVQEDE